MLQFEFKMRLKLGFRLSYSNIIVLRQVTINSSSSLDLSSAEGDFLNCPKRNVDDGGFCFERNYV